MEGIYQDPDMKVKKVFTIFARIFQSFNRTSISAYGGLKAVGSRGRFRWIRNPARGFKKPLRLLSLKRFLESFDHN
jgi:hypothetical protein